MSSQAAHVNSHPHPSDDALARRVALLRRMFQRQLSQRPTAHQRMLRDRAATLTAIAESAALDPAVTWNDKVRLDHAAALARVEWSAATSRSEAPTLQAILAGVE